MTKFGCKFASEVPDDKKEKQKNNKVKRIWTKNQRMESRVKSRYLKEINGRVSTTEDVQERRNTLALRV